MGGRGQKRQGSRSGIPDITFDDSGEVTKIKTGADPYEVLEKASDAIRDLEYEVSVLITPDGTVYTAKGTTSKVTPPYEAVEADGYDVSTLVDLHNHPGGAPPSPADWDTMIYLGQSVSYVSSNRGDYVIKITDQSKIGKAIAFFSEAGGKTSNYERNADKAYSAGCLSYYSKPGGYSKALYHTAEKFGPRYGFSIEFKPKPGWENYYD